MITEQQVISFLKGKDVSYIESLVSSLKETPNSVNDLSFTYCPKCGSVSFKKNGKDDDGNQRFYCHDCHHTFTYKTGSFFSHSHLSFEQWKMFIECELSNMKLVDISHFVGISVTSAFFNRHKLYKAISQIKKDEKLETFVEVDANYRKINLKGTRTKNMPRKSKKRGSASAYSGISHHKICIICAVDNYDHILMNITGLGPETFDKYKNNIEHFKNVKTVVSDSKTCIQQFSNYMKANNDKIPSIGGKERYLTDSGNSLSTINEIMTGLSGLITRTRGISTRYLQEYIHFYIYKKQLHYQFKRNEMLEEIINILDKTQHYTNKMILETKLPISLKEAYFEYRYGIFE